MEVSFTDDAVKLDQYAASHTATSLHGMTACVRALYQQSYATHLDALLYLRRIQQARD